MNNKYTHIVYVIDESGSMGPLASDVKGGYDSYINEQKKLEGKATVTLITFQSFTTTKYSFKDIQQIESLRYVPGGTTRLYDTIGDTILKTGNDLLQMNEEDRPGKVLFIIVTDGYDNESTKYPPARIKEMISHQTEKYNWEFVFAAANQDAILKGSEMGIAASNSLNISNTSKSISNLYGSLNNITSMYRSGAQYNVAFSQEDRLAQSNS